MVAPTHNMNDGREERVARYKEERRRQLAAQFGSRGTGSDASCASVVRSTRASRLRSQATESARTHTRPTTQQLQHHTPEANKHDEDNHCNGDVNNKKEKDKSHKRKSYLNRSLTAEPVLSSASPTSSNGGSGIGERRRQVGMVSPSSLGGGVRVQKALTSSSLVATSVGSGGSSSSSPIPRSSQLVKRHTTPTTPTPLAFPKRADRGSTPESDASSGNSSRIPRKITSPQVSSPLSSPNHRTPPHSIPQRALAKSSGSSGESSPLKLSSLPSSPARQPHSILKKSSLDETGTFQQQPVSILKRKTSQEDGGRSGSPVRFSPNVVERKGRGILKKHRSLDDSRHSPDSLQHSQNGFEEYRPILKSQQRRCSLEEVVKSSNEPQGILKRKTSRDEVPGETGTPPEPQGILKRKPSPSHISVAESVIKSAAESLHDLDHVRPILKKKEEPILEAVHVGDQAPRPILKKKSSSEEEEHPVKPILKAPKKEEEMIEGFLSSCESPTRRQSTEPKKPILKHSDEQTVTSPPSSPPVGVTLRNKYHQQMSSGEPVPAHTPNRMSLDPNLVFRRSKSPLAMDMARPRPLSVAERIYNLESFLALEGELAPASRRPSSSASVSPQYRMDEKSSKEDVASGLQRSGSVSERASMWAKLEQENSAEAAAHRKLNKGIRSRSKLDAGRYSTQPVTQGEVEQAKRNNTLDCVDEEDPSRLSVTERVRLFNRSGTSSAVINSGITESETPQPRGGGSMPKAEALSSLPPRPLTASVPRAQSSSIVAGLMKNLAQKSTGSIPKIVRSRQGSESGEDTTSAYVKMKSAIEDTLRRSQSVSSSSSSDDEDEDEEASSDEEEEGGSYSSGGGAESEEVRKIISGRNETGVTKVLTKNKKPADDGGRKRATDEDETSTPTTEDYETSSSGGREIRSIMTNGTSEKKRMLRCGEVTAMRRCATQPMPPLHKASHHHHHHLHATSAAIPALIHDDTDDSPLPTTIKQRLEALQKSGQSDWRKRVSKPNPENELPSGEKNRGVLAERVGKLECATQGWKSRVSASDSHQFTVAGRLNTSSSPTPSLGPASRTPLPQIFNSASAAAVHDLVASAQLAPRLAEQQPAFLRSTSVPDNNEKSNEVVQGPKVSVPDLWDDEFASFFSSPLASLPTNETDEFCDIDFGHITTQPSQLLVHKKHVRVQRKYKSLNPLKALAQRSDLKREYVEVRSTSSTNNNSRELLLSRLNIDNKFFRNSGLALEALAGLASKEDLKAISLRKASESPLPWAVSQWNHPLLLRVKGRRHAITTVVKPHYSTINQGDTFILVTQNQVFHWIGEYCNVIEKSRGSEIATEIQSRRDLGCTGASHVVTIVGNGYSERHSQFWQLLSLPASKLQTYTGEPAGHPDEDEVYEAAMAETYTVYTLSKGQLVPVQSYWGRMPKIDVLDASKVLVFDFGSEVYVWGGKNTELRDKKLGTQLAKELAKERHIPWQRTDIEWLDREMEGKSRPAWSIVCKVTQHMEPVLFREKFLDWPAVDVSLNSAGLDKQVDGSVEVYPCSVDDMISWSPPPPDFILEGTHLGRGKVYFDTETRRHFEIVTESLRAWKVEDYKMVEINHKSLGHFKENESYKLRWDYRVNVTGRELSGKISKHGKRQVGRERAARILWQGKEAVALEQGAAAALVGASGDGSDETTSAGTVIIRQGYEPPALNAALPGPLVIHSAAPQSVRVFLCTGVVPEEATLQELPGPPSPLHLRSRASIWVLHTTTGRSYLWHGVHSLPSTRKVALEAVNYLRDTCPPELCLGDSVSDITVEEIMEGEEPLNFIPGLENKRELYGSLLGTKQEYTSDSIPAMKMFHLSSTLGVFKSSPIVSVTYHPNFFSPYPYTQQDLYSVNQPGLVLVDGRGVGSGVWLWQGWCDETVEKGGSVWVRYQAERRAAMTTALQYWHDADASTGTVTPPVRLVHAGLEPVQFTSLFPSWTPHTLAADFNKKEGYTEGCMESIQDELSKLNKCTYPPSVLLQHPLPPGVDPTRLELYLDRTHFKELLGVEPDEFRELPAWKQTKIKKTAGLF